MPTIRCYYEECIYLSKGFCSASSIELDPEDGCLTYSEEEIPDPIYFDEEDNLDDIEDDWEDEGFEELDLDEDEEDM